MSGILQHLCFGLWLTKLSTVSSAFIHAIVGVRVLLLFEAGLHTHAVCTTDHLVSGGLWMQTRFYALPPVTVLRCTREQMPVPAETQHSPFKAAPSHDFLQHIQK